MINVKNLQIGDWVEVLFISDEPENCGYKNCRVQGLNFFGDVIVEGEQVTETQLNPIPLTEELLEKCGFRKMDGFVGVFYRYSEDLCVKPYLDGDFLFSFSHRSEDINVYVKHVHDFQQLLRKCNVNIEVEL